MKRLLLLCLAYCSLSACAMRLESQPVPPLPPPPPPAPAPMMSYEEAVQRGASYARERGYGYRLQAAHLANGRLWKVVFRIFEEERPGRLRLEYDAYSHQLLSADARLGRGHGEDDDEHGEHGEHEGRHGEHEGHHRGGWERDDQ